MCWTGNATAIKKIAERDFYVYKIGKIVWNNIFISDIRGSDMIDDKKIEEVAKVYMIGEFYDKDEAEWNYPITNEEKRNQCIIDFKAGAKWAINEFLKDLWHPISEEPRKFAEVLAEVKITESIKTYISFKRNDALFKNWDAYCSGANITRWLYINDLFPNEED